MGDKSLSVELAAAELSKGMLGLIGAYGITAGAEVRVVALKAASPPPERVPADAELAANVPAASE